MRKQKPKEIKPKEIKGLTPDLPINGKDLNPRSLVIEQLHWTSLMVI